MKKIKEKIMFPSGSDWHEWFGAIPGAIDDENLRDTRRTGTGLVVVRAERTMQRWRE